MTEKYMVSINFGGKIDYFEAKDYYFNTKGNVVIDKFDGTKVITSSVNVMVEVVKVED